MPEFPTQSARILLVSQISRPPSPLSGTPMTSKLIHQFTTTFNVLIGKQVLPFSQRFMLAARCRHGNGCRNVNNLTVTKVLIWWISQLTTHSFHL